jgi:hypothetical protein
MSRSSLSDHSRRTEKQAKDTSEKLRKLAATESEGIRTAEKTGGVSSELEDIRAELKRAKEPIFASIEQATREDDQEVQVEEKAASEHAKELSDISTRTSSEQAKAESIHSGDARIQSGSDLASILRKTKEQLSDLGRRQSALAADAAQKRKYTEQRTKAALERNRKS